MVGIAHAMGQAGAPGTQGTDFSFFIMMFAMFAIFYFLLLRPQQKKAKEHRDMLTNLKKGDRVVTSGGIYGRVTNMDEATFTLEIADKVRIKVVRGNISALLGPTNQPQASKPENENNSKQ